MDALEAQAFADAMYECILKHAKPTITLAELKIIASDFMDENQMRVSLGRLWRSAEIFRRSLENNQVLYWTKETVNVVKASGIEPDLPSTYAQGGETKPLIPPTPVVASKSKIEPALQVEIQKEERKAVNKIRSRGQLIPISQTAKVPMRPEVKGEYGSMRRASLTGKVAMVMFKYRDVALSIDAATHLCGNIKREDVMRVLTQNVVSGRNEPYFIRIAGEMRADSKYQWNTYYCYPFTGRYPSDGENVPVVNADEEAQDDQQLDHLPTEALTEDETESEIARLLRERMIEQAAEQEAASHEETEVETQVAHEAETEVETQAKDEIAMEDSVDELTSTIKIVSVNSEKKESLPVEKTSIEIDTKTPIDMNMFQGGPGQIKSYIQADSLIAAPFRAGIFSTGELILTVDGTTRTLNKEQTDQLIDLLGPHFLARKA